jgi:hypothetical protein
MKGSRLVPNRDQSLLSIWFHVLVAVAVATNMSASGVSAAIDQTGTNLQRPPTWKVRYDQPGASGREHLVMRPGWHINPGPAAVFWDPGQFAAGAFSLTSTIFLFPPGQGAPPSEVDTPYGLLVGGSGLDGADPSWVVFLVRNDRQFQIVRREGSSARDLVPWTPHKAIAVVSGESGGTARNVMAIDVTADAVAFFVNDEPVASLPRSAAPVEGTVGLRAGAGLSLHITDLVIGPNRR